VNLTSHSNRQHFVLRIDELKMAMQGEHEAGMLRLTRVLPIDLAALMAAKHSPKYGIGPYTSYQPPPLRTAVGQPPSAIPTNAYWNASSPSSSPSSSSSPSLVGPLGLGLIASTSHTHNHTSSSSRISSTQQNPSDTSSPLSRTPSSSSSLTVNSGTSILDGSAQLR
jgi:hypothetical protein